MDVYAGVTRCPVLINEYLRGDSETMDAFHLDGAVPGFFLYPLDCFEKEEERGKAVLDFRDALEAAVRKAAGEVRLPFWRSHRDILRVFGLYRGTCRGFFLRRRTF